MKHRGTAGVLVLLGAAAGQIGCSLILGLKDRTDLGTGGGGGESDGGTPAACIPRDSSSPIDDACGVFVSSSIGVDGMGATSKAHPFKTLAAATLAAGKAKKPVYACAETFTEALTVTSEVAIYGGLDCAKAWAYDGSTKSKLSALPDDVPLTLTQAATSVQLFDFTVHAADAMLDGGSSIAVVADQVKVSFTRCDLSAGNGNKGAGGTTPTASVGPANSLDPLIVGNDGANACASAMASPGAEQKDNMFCPFADGGPLGGGGGLGSVPVGGAGDAFPSTPQVAQGGTGQHADPAWSCDVGAGLGADGVAGQPGADGSGAKGTSALGQLSPSGYKGTAGMPGDPGKAGQGGGGGGGSKGKAGCAGASGGGGGAGGCGGGGGPGASGGGASIVMVSVDATLSFDHVTIVVGNGGTGGDGGVGQFGATGGHGGLPGAATSGVLAGCPGGAGGYGAHGGHGGGGRGGHAIGIAATGADMPDTKGITFLEKGTAGLGGKGGPMNDGDPGVRANVQLFP